MRPMTRHEIESVFERVKTWPRPLQEDAARTLLRMEEQGTGLYVLSAEDEAAIDEAEASGLASDEEVRAFFDRYK